MIEELRERGVSIGKNVFIGAGSIINKNIPDNSVVVGNPARIIGNFEEYIKKNQKLMKKAPIYNTYWKDKTEYEKKKMQKEISIGCIGFDIY